MTDRKYNNPDEPFQRSHMDAILQVNSKAVELQTEVSGQYEEIIETTDGIKSNQSKMLEETKDIKSEIRNLREEVRAVKTDLIKIIDLQTTIRAILGTSVFALVASVLLALWKR